jgi:phenylacetate-CoA ligase
MWVLKSYLIEKVLLQLGDMLLGSSFVKELKKHRIYNSFNKAKLEMLQKQKLEALLNHAVTNTDYYKHHQKGDMTLMDWYNSFPILHKKDTLKFGDQLISKTHKKETLIKYESSGSSGIRSVVYMDKLEQSILRAILMNWWEWNRYYIGKPMFQTGMSPNRGMVKAIKDRLFSTHYFVAFGLNENKILESLRSIEHKGNMHLFGYASSLYEIAKVANKHNLKIKFDKAMSQGDKLFNHYITEISQAFGCEVVEDYGLNEGFMIGQKKDLPYFYIYTPSVYIEIVDNNNCPVPDGEMGRIIATKLDGYAMPLIRYDTGDLGIILPKEKYPEKRDFAFPLLEKVVGRNTDIITTSDGSSLIVHTFTGIFEFFPEIEQFQVVQNEIDTLLIKYIPSDNFNNSVLKKIEESFSEKTKSRIKINWEEVDKIDASKSGKPQIIVNNLIKNSLTEIN